jgi:hypothetical protein
VAVPALRAGDAYGTAALGLLCDAKGHVLNLATAADARCGYRGQCAAPAPRIQALCLSSVAFPHSVVIVPATTSVRSIGARGTAAIDPQVMHFKATAAFDRFSIALRRTRSMPKTVL